tara:strand:+ start:841 stop:1056 length:216 start_codon:yes stop_codon:yes gene_type:complete
MERYTFIFDGKEKIRVPGKGLKEALREYKQQNPKQLVATVEWVNKNGSEQKQVIQLRQLNIGIDRHGNIIR